MPMNSWQIRMLVPFLFVASCASGDKADYKTLFEKLTYPGEEWSELDYGSVPSSSDKELLAKYNPLFWIPDKACGPMDFYRQYVPRLVSEVKGQHIRGSRQSLKTYERVLSVKWEIESPPDCVESKTPPLYAYAWDETMIGEDGATSYPIKVLKYAFAFYKSGLPSKQPTLLKLGRVLGNPNRWHYLDIHGAVFILLNQRQEPFALVLAQHNHFRTYVVGHDIESADKLNICYAKRSNEPYLCDENQKSHPTAPTFRNMEWIITGKNKPFLGAWDVLPSEDKRTRVNYTLEYLPSRDPLITSWNSLGPDIKIWGLFHSFFRNAPPGMAIYNLPDLKPVWKTAQAFYFDPNNKEVFRLHYKNSKDFFNTDVQPVLDHNAKFFFKSLKRASIQL